MPEAVQWETSAHGLLQIWEEQLSTLHAVEPSAAMRWLGIQIEQQRRADGQETPQALDSAGLDSGSGRQPVDSKQPGNSAWQDRPQEAAVSDGYAQASSIRWLQHLQGYRDRKGLAKKSRRPTSWVQSTGESGHTCGRNRIAWNLLLYAST